VQDAEFMKCPKESPGSLFKSIQKSLFPNPLSKPIFAVQRTGQFRKSQLEEMQIPSEMDKQKIPRHIAIIMDGNGRWARQQGMAARIFGHRNAIKAVREATEGCAELGVEFLTLYAFSTENWGRPKEEVMALMELLVQTIREETPTLEKNNIKLTAIGDIAGLPKRCQDELAQTMEKTAGNKGMVLSLALNYSGRWEITEAANRLKNRLLSGETFPENLSEDDFAALMPSFPTPDPELLIRSSGEMRVSNFLLWQIAYTELFVTPVLWPDFDRKVLHEAIISYQTRDRRFGKV
jgi:undecaprenyl diphosphate synthase